MKRKRLGAKAVALVSAAAVLLGISGALLFVPGGAHSLRLFDPARTADLELKMWQAYYANERAYLFRLLVTMLHEQYGYSWGKAMTAGFYLARAATTFARSRSEYERVLPDLTRAYEIARSWTGGRFDPEAVARAELAWWVARRNPAQQSVKIVGGLIADEYALLYDVPRSAVTHSALLRAEAGALRDQGGERADWIRIGVLLRESYDNLHQVLSSKR
jgi:hypothetical protein